MSDCLNVGSILFNEWNYRLSIIFGDVFCFVLYLFRWSLCSMEFPILNNIFYWFRFLFYLGPSFWWVDFKVIKSFAIIFFLRNSLVFAYGPVIMEVVKRSFSEPCDCESIHQSEALVFCIMLSIDIKDGLDHDRPGFGGYIFQNAPK